MHSIQFFLGIWFIVLWSNNTHHSNTNLSKDLTDLPLLPSLASGDLAVSVFNSIHCGDATDPKQIYYMQIRNNEIRLENRSAFVYLFKGSWNRLRCLQGRTCKQIWGVRRVVLSQCLDARSIIYSPCNDQALSRSTTSCVKIRP
jgi:hypothetical protein